MINLSFDKLRLIAQSRNMSDYENQSKEDLIKVLSDTKHETPKSETPRIPKLKTPKTPKTETPKTKKTKLEIRVNKRKF